jgi:heme/copper-type cytochrome/quinol oxidase subunit 2
MKTSARIRMVGMAALLAVPAPAHACAVCFGAPDSPLTQGMAWGILSLLGLVAVVLMSVATFFIYLARRAATHGGASALSESTNQA